jgi:branched-chain amino acid transport system substrate-binding protein
MPSGLLLAAMLALQRGALTAATTEGGPYLRLREATLGYHGPDPDLSALADTRIGWFGPTNLNDPLTGDLWWAASRAVEEANAAAPPGTRSFRLVPRWSADPWGSGVSQLARMVYQEQPVALLGSIDSASTHLAEQVVAKANLPLVSPLATDPSVTLAGVPWMFSCAPSDDAVAGALVADLLLSLEATPGRLALLATTDHESRMTTRAVLREMSRRGRLPDFRFDVRAGSLDPEVQLEAMVTAKPSAVLLIAGPDDAARLLRAARTRLADSGTCRFFGSHAMARHRFRELAGASADEVRFPVLTTPDPSCPVTARFYERFSAERGHAPDDAALLTYDATRLLLEAIRRSGPTRAGLRATLAGLGPWPGVSGTIHFDGTGQNTRANLAIATIRNGIPSSAKAPASPSNLTSRNLIAP